MFPVPVWGWTEAATPVFLFPLWVLEKRRKSFYFEGRDVAPLHWRWWALPGETAWSCGGFLSSHGVLCRCRFSGWFCPPSWSTSCVTPREPPSCSPSPPSSPPTCPSTRSCTTLPRSTRSCRTPLLRTKGALLASCRKGSGAVVFECLVWGLLPKVSSENCVLFSAAAKTFLF